MSIGAVNIAIGATTGDFEKALAAASSAVGNFRDNFKSAFEGLKGSADSPKYAFQAVNRELQKTASEMRNILASGGQVSDELRRKYEALRATVVTVNGAFNQTKAVQTGLSGSLASMATGYFSVAAAIGAVRKGLSVTTDMQRLDTSLKAVSTSTADYNNAQQLLLGTSNRLGVSYEALAQSYKGIKAATNGTVLEGRAIEKIFLSVVKASATLQLSAEDTKGALLALQQMISKGTVSAEELRGQLGERIPGAFRLFAEAAGVSEQKLGDMLKQGEILATDILPKFAEKLETAFGAQAQANLNTMGGGMQRLTDQAGLLVAALSDTSGVTNFFAVTANGVADVLAGIRQAVRDRDWLTFFGALSPSAGGQSLREKLARSQQNQNKVAEFQAMAPEQRRQTLDNLKSKIAEGRAQIAGGVDNTGLKALLREREDLLLAFQKANLKLVLEERKGTDKKSPADSADERTAIEKAKDRYKDLGAEIANLRYQGKKPPQEMLEEYKKLGARLTATENSFKRVRAEAVKPLFKDASSPVSVYTQLLGEVEKKIDSFVLSGQEIPKMLADQRDGYKMLIAEMKQVPQALLNIQKLQPKKNYSAGKPLPNLPGAEQFDKESPYGGLFKSVDGQRRVDKGSKEFQEFAKDIEGTYTAGSAKKALQRFTEILEDPNLSPATAFQKATTKVIDAGSAMKSSISAALSGAAQSALIGMGELIGGLIAGTAKLSDIPNMIGLIFADISKNMGKALIAFGTAGIAAKALYLNPVTAIAAGVALTALGSALGQSIQKSYDKGIPAFANGGLVFGPTVGLIGEGRGTTPRNPEVIAPLDKLKDFMFKGVDAGFLGSQANTFMDYMATGINAVARASRMNTLVDRIQPIVSGPSKVEVTGHFRLSGMDLETAVYQARQAKEDWGIR